MLPGMSKPKLVWSDDPKDQSRVEGKSAKTANEVLSPPTLDFTAVFRLEKNGRGGKTVTVINRLPRHERFLKDLCKELKTRCGSGGTFELKSDGGAIEIQGDQRETIKAIFAKKHIRFKGM